MNKLYILLKCLFFFFKNRSGNKLHYNMHQIVWVGPHSSTCTTELSGLSAALAVTQPPPPPPSENPFPVSGTYLKLKLELELWGMKGTCGAEGGGGGAVTDTDLSPPCARGKHILLMPKQVRIHPLF